MKKLTILCSLSIGLLFLFSLMNGQQFDEKRLPALREQKTLTPQQPPQVKPLVAEKQEELYVSAVEGEVFFQKSEKAQEGMAIRQADELSTKNGRAEIYLGKENWLRLDKNTLVFFSSFENPTRISLVQGNIHLDLQNKIEVWGPKEVLTPEPGEYRMDLSGKKIEVYPNPRVADSFDSWNREMEKGAGISVSEYQEKTTRVKGYYYDVYPTWGWYFCWHPWLFPVWSYWYWYFPYSYYPPQYYRDYWDSGKYGYQYARYSGHRTISAGQLRSPRYLSANPSFRSAESRVQSFNATSATTSAHGFVSTNSRSISDYPSRLSQASSRNSASSNPHGFVDSLKRFSGASPRLNPRSSGLSRSHVSPRVSPRSSGLYRPSFQSSASRSSGSFRSSVSSRPSGHSSGSIRKR